MRLLKIHDALAGHFTKLTHGESTHITESNTKSVYAQCTWIRNGKCFSLCLFNFWEIRNFRVEISWNLEPDTFPLGDL